MVRDAGKVQRSLNLSIMATELLCGMLALLCSERKRRKKREIDWFLNFMKRTLGAHSELMLPGSVCLVAEKKVFLGNISRRNSAMLLLNVS